MRNLVNDDNVVKKRRGLDRLEKFFPPHRSTKIEPVSAKGFKAEWIKTPRSRDSRVVLYIHGGGFVLYPKLYRDMISRIATASQSIVLSLDYSLSPEHKYPTALYEALAAYSWLLKDYQAKDIALAGDSAGGALVLSLIHLIHKKKLPNPACAVVLSPATDATLSGKTLTSNKKKDFFLSTEALDYFVGAYFGDQPRDNPIASPLFGTFENFPPLLVHTDKSEVMYDDSARLINKAKQAGVKVESYETDNLWHVYHIYARYVPDAKKAIDHIGRFIQNNFT